MKSVRKQRPWALVIFLAWLASCSTLRAEDASGDSLLTLGRLFGTKEFDTESLPARRWSKRTSTYFTLEKPPAGPGRDVVRTDPENLDVQLLEFGVIGLPGREVRHSGRREIDPVKLEED